MADNTKFLLFGAAGVAVWWFYFRNQMPADAVYMGQVPIGATCQGGSSPATTVMYEFHSPSTGKYYCTSTAPTAAQGQAAQAAMAAITTGQVQAAAQSLGPAPSTAAAPATVEAIQVGTLLAAGAPAEGLPVDSWGWYVNQQLAPLGKAAPDPMPLFQTAVPGFARSQAVTAAQYWSVMGPALKSQLGLSGLGLYRWVQ